MSAPLGLDERLLEILRCPCDAHGELAANEAASTLTCAACGRAYRVDNGIPVMLMDEATITKAELA